MQTTSAATNPADASFRAYAVMTPISGKDFMKSHMIPARVFTRSDDELQAGKSRGLGFLIVENAITAWQSGQLYIARMPYGRNCCRSLNVGTCELHGRDFYWQLPRLSVHEASEVARSATNCI